MKTLGITPGSGIGPELLHLALSQIQIPSSIKVLCFDAESPQEALLQAIKQAQSGNLDALVTGPVHKSILQNIEGQSYPGQTELLSTYLSVDSKPALMCFAGGPFVLGLATGHVPIKQVSEIITPEYLTQKLSRLLEGSGYLLGKNPKDIRLVVLGLNPHAGEGGLIGHEEEQIIDPVIQVFRSQGYHIRGPLPADGFFGFGLQQGLRVDAVMAMTHDQGLGPYKLLSKSQAVNITLGLKILRTSPAHGTADDLVGTHTANPASFVRAIQVALDHLRPLPSP